MTPKSKNSDAGNWHMPKRIKVLSLSEKVWMYRTRHGVYSAQHYPWFGAISGGLEMYPLGITGDECMLL